MYNFVARIGTGICQVYGTFPKFKYLNLSFLVCLLLYIGKMAPNLYLTKANYLMGWVTLLTGMWFSLLGFQIMITTKAITIYGKYSSQS